MVAYKPHRARVRKAEDIAGDSGAIEDLGHDAVHMVRCSVQPYTVERAFEATGINIASPWVVYLEVCDAEGLKDGDEFEVFGKKLRIRGDVVRHDSGLPTSHARAYCEEVRR